MNKELTFMYQGEKQFFNMTVNCVGALGDLEAN